MIGRGAAIRQFAPTVFRESAPLALALGVQWVAWGRLIQLCRTFGPLVLPIDDAYIHLAVAKHLALDGVWGVTPFAFSASVSSLAWSMLVAAPFRLVGPSVVWPVAMNAALATALLVLADAVLARHGVRARWRAIALLVLGFVTPLPCLVLLGMEHVLQCLVSLALVACLARTLASPNAPRASAAGRGLGSSAAVLGLAFLVTAVRYDGLVLLAAAVVVCAAARRWRLAAGIALAGAIPLIAFAAVSISHGWLPIPNPVLVRLPLLSEPRSGGRALLHLLGYRGLRTLMEEPVLATLFTAALVLLAVRWRQEERSTEDIWMLAIFAGTLALHVQFAAVGWMFRYEAYLVATGLTVLAVSGAELFRHLRPGWAPATRAAVAAALLLAALPLSQRGVDAWRLVPVSAAEQFHTRHQVAAFLARFYDGRAVALGDIGEACYRANLRLVDINGLGSRDLLASILSAPDRWAPPSAQRAVAAARTRLAVADWGGTAPEGWERVGCWASGDSTDCAEAEIQFYVPLGGASDEVARQLASFALPHDRGALRLHLTPRGPSREFD